MSDEYPTQTPPPDYTPAPPPVEYGPAAFGGYAAPDSYTTEVPDTPAPPRKKKTGLIIGIVIGILLLCCCIPAAIGGVLFITSDSVSTSTTEDLLGELTGEPADPEDAARIDEWLAWAPVLPGELASPPADKIALATEALPIVAPGLEPAAMAWHAGYYEADDDWYYADLFLVQGVHPSTDQVSAAIQLYIQSDEMIAEQVPFDADEDDIVTTIAGGSRELLYDPTWDASRLSFDDTDTLALWQRIGEDWPDAVVMDLYEDDPGSGAWTIELTTWRAFAIWEESPRVYTSYEQVDGDWNLVDWEYYEPSGGEGASVPSDSST